MAGDQDVWSKLPHEVMESIFSRLSVYDIVRAGCTCTRLRAFIFSHRLLPSSSVSILLLVHPLEISEGTHDDSAAWVYDRTHDAWLNFSLAFLRPNLSNIAFPYPVCSAGSLLCFVSGNDFVICNPIIRSWRRLPTLPRLTQMENGTSVQVAFDEHSVEAFGLICNPITGTYEFFIIHHSSLQSETNLTLTQYSSSMSQWRVLPPFIMNKPCVLHSNTITLCSSRLYTLWEKGDSLMVLSYCNGGWAEIESPDCTSTLQEAYLLDFHGRLHMVGAVGSVWRIHIWELDVESTKWMKVTWMPSLVLQEFRSLIDCYELQCWGKDGVMYMKSLQSEVLMYELSGNEWKWLKDLELDVALEGLIFEPSLSALA